MPCFGLTGAPEFLLRFSWDFLVSSIVSWEKKIRKNNLGLGEALTALRIVRYQASRSLAVLKADRREKRDDREGLKRLQQGLKAHRVDLNVE